mgnify:CR=1 FL=1
MEYKYLIFVEGDTNHNKFYEMVPNEAGTSFIVHYGRVGAKAAEVSYSSHDFDKKLREKLKKGYKDVTDLHKETTSVKWLDEKDPVCQDLVAFLLSVARQKIADNYQGNTDAITQEMVDKAQACLTSIAVGTSIDDFNAKLEELFQILPRKMKNVREYLASQSADTSDMVNILDREQTLLDTLAGQVKANSVMKKAADEGKQTTVLGAFNTSIRIATDAEKEIVYDKLGSYKHQVHQIYAVSNENTNKKFNAWKGNSTHTDLLWHGSRTENWLSITATGLCLNPNAVTTGHMFGYGIYFAPSPSKSAGYTDQLGSRWANGHGGRAFLGLFEVHTGKKYKVKDHTYECGSMTLDKLHKKGDYDCLWADSSHGMLRADEVIIYDDSQATIRFLVELNQ